MRESAKSFDITGEWDVAGDGTYFFYHDGTYKHVREYVQEGHYSSSLTPGGVNLTTHWERTFDETGKPLPPPRSWWKDPSFSVAIDGDTASVEASFPAMDIPPRPPYPGQHLSGSKESMTLWRMKAVDH